MYDRANNLIKWLMILGAIFVAVGLLIMWASRANASDVGNGPCQNPTIPANEQLLEVIGNTQGGVEYNVAGVLSLQDTRPETTITETCNKKGLNCKVTAVNLPPKAHVTLRINNGTERQYTIDAGSSIALPWMTVEANAFFSVTLESDQPLNCTGSDLTVDETSDR